VNHTPDCVTALSAVQAQGLPAACGLAVARDSIQSLAAVKAAFPSIITSSFFG